MKSHRHSKEFTFPDYTPPFVKHVKELWKKSFDNDNRQQPTRPVGVESNGERALARSSVNSGWEHLRATFHAMSKVYSIYLKFFYSIISLCCNNIQTNKSILDQKVDDVGALYWSVLRPSSLKSFVTSQYDNNYQMQTITNRYLIRCYKTYNNFI